MNKLLILYILIFVVSCQTKNDVFINQHNYLFDELNEENSDENTLFESTFKNRLNRFDYAQGLPELTEGYFKIDSILQSTNQWNIQNLQNVRNKILVCIANRNIGKYHFLIDTISLDLSKCNPRDTSLLNSVIHTSKLLESALNPIEIRVLFGSHIRAGFFMQFNRSLSCDFGGRLTHNVKYTNKIFYKDEKVFIIPAFYKLNEYDKTPIYLLKENSTEFIMENGEKKNFTNPITLKASSKKGVHTVKGVVMVKYKGELVPKPFEFRYIVE